MPPYIDHSYVCFACKGGRGQRKQRQAEERLRPYIGRVDPGKTLVKSSAFSKMSHVQISPRPITSVLFASSPTC